MKNLALAIVVRDGKVLIQKRFRRNLGMVYEFPGGAVNNAETSEAAAIRELNEETGLIASETLGVHKAQNEFGGDIYYVVLSISDDAQPQVIEPVRQQSFFWFCNGEIPLGDFFKADLEFIATHLSKYT